MSNEQRVEAGGFLCESDFLVKTMLKNVENRKKGAAIDEVRGGEKSVFSFQFSVS